MFASTISSCGSEGAGCSNDSGVCLTSASEILLVLSSFDGSLTCCSSSIMGFESLGDISGLAPFELSFE
jgi:hypothetical protein